MPTAFALNQAAQFAQSQRTSQVYYPSLICHFRIRFDEAFHVIDPEPTSVESLALGVAVASSFGIPANQVTARPLIISGSQDQLSIVANRVPKTCALELPGPRQAATFHAVFDWRDLPLDARLIRNSGIEIHIGTVNPKDFATGVTHVGPDGRRVSILRPSPATEKLVGIVDRALVRHSASGSILEIEGRDLRGILIDSPWNPAGYAKLDISRPVDDVVVQILKRHPFGGRFVVAVSPDDWKGTTAESAGLGAALGAALGGGAVQAPKVLLPSPGATGILPRVRMGANGQSPQSMPAGAGGGDNVSFWDLITHFCQLVGAVPFFYGQELRIRPGRTLYDQLKAGFDPAVPTPFAGGKTRSTMMGDPPQRVDFSVRKFIYGRNVEELSFERKYNSAAKARVVRCVSIDTSSKKRGQGKIVSGEWPDAKSGKADAVNAARTTSVSPSGRLSDSEVLTIPIPGVKDPALLRQIAQDIFHEIGRGELGGSVTSSDLASFGGDNMDPDNLSLSSGDAVELGIDTRSLSSRSPLVNQVVDFHRMTFEQAVREVQRRLGDGLPINASSQAGGLQAAISRAAFGTAGQQNLARAIVASARGNIVELNGVGRFFRVGTVRFDYNEGKIRISFDFQNFVDVRSRVEAKPAANKATVQRKTVKMA